MSTNSTNPFVLPGMGQTGEHASNPLLASMEMMRQAFAGLSGAGGLTAGLPMSPPMNPEELARKIAELKNVENWLKLNLSMLSSTIQGMEVQLATIATLRSFATSMGVKSAADPEGPSALEVLLGLRPQTRSGDATASAYTSSFSAPRQSAADATPAPAAPKAVEPQEPAPASENAAQQAQTTAAIPAAAQAWWNMLQQQFDQVAAATAASMAASVAKAESKRAASPAAHKATPAAPPSRKATAKPAGTGTARSVKK